MRGEISLINKAVVEDTKCPVKDSIGGLDPLRIVSVINDEYWKEFKRKMDYTPASAIKVVGLGRWSFSYSYFKRYIRELIRSIRATRIRLKRLQENPEFVNENSLTWILLKDMELKLQISLKQLNEQRAIYILKILSYMCKKRATDPNFTYKVDYTWFPYSFKEQLRNNTKIDYKLVDNT